MHILEMVFNIFFINTVTCLCLTLKKFTAWIWLTSCHRYFFQEVTMVCFKVSLYIDRFTYYRFITQYAKWYVVSVVLFISYLLTVCGVLHCLVLNNKKYNYFNYFITGKYLIFSKRYTNWFWIFSYFSFFCF